MQIAKAELEPSLLQSPRPAVSNLLLEASDITWKEPLDSDESQVALIRRRGCFRLLRQQQFKNSLLASVGCLELANALDFPANVWNQIPVPKFAAVLMGLGGTAALCMVLFAIWDFGLSWKNVRLLRAEREHLQRLRQNHSKNTELARLLDARLGVNDREIGSEVVDRILMDLFLGVAAVLVGVGTLMAIGGANRRVFVASNLLSGYVGNSLAAFFGLVNAVWSGYLIRRFQNHIQAVRAALPSDYIRRRAHTRFRLFQWHSFINGLAGLVSGAASMVTATRWWGYVVLIPCITAMIMSNYFWRKRIGYDRRILTQLSLQSLQPAPLPEDLEYVIDMQCKLVEPDRQLSQRIVQTNSLDSMLQFITCNCLLETYCESLSRENETRSLLQQIPISSTAPGQITISFDVLVRLSSSNREYSTILMNHSKKFLRTDGIRVFAHRERYLLELLGYALWRDQIAVSTFASVETKQLYNS